MAASDASDVVRPAAVISSSLDQVPTVAAGPGGSSSGCYDDGAVGGVGVTVTAMDSNVTDADLWCPVGHSSMPRRKPLDTWSSSDDYEDLPELFSRIGLGKYTDIFQQQEVSEYYQFMLAHFWSFMVDIGWQFSNSLLPHHVMSMHYLLWNYTEGMFKAGMVPESNPPAF